MSPALTISIPHPPHSAVRPMIDATIMFPFSCHIPSPVELRAEWLQLRSQEPDVATHNAEVGNLLSLHPKIHRLPAHAKISSGLLYRERNLICGEQRRERSNLRKLLQNLYRAHSFPVTGAS